MSETRRNNVSEAPMEPEEIAVGESPAELPAGNEMPEGEDQGDLSARLAEAEAEIARLKNDYLRALADAENVRRRAARDREDAHRYAIAAFARDLLSVADNLARALASVEPDARGKDTALDALMGGIELTERELQTVFERYGVRRIDAGGEPFDPHRHEAMFEVSNPDVPHGTVVQVLQEGYLLHDRTLRPAQVAVSRGGRKTAAPAAAAGGDGEAERVAGAPETDIPSRASAQAYRKRDADDRSPGSALDETL